MASLPALPGTSDHLSPVWTTYTDLQVVSGRGSTIVTADGTEYLDLTSGIGVTSTGHCHPEVVAAIARQAASLIHAQVNVYRHNLLGPLADRLAELTPEGIDCFFFTNSGAEAVEAAVKLAKHATGRQNVITFRGAFHGRTHLAMAMTSSNAGYRAGYAPLPGGIHVAPFAGEKDDVEGALAALRSVFDLQSAPSDTAAVVIEPVMGEGGYLPAAPAFLQGVEKLCRELGVLFVADEIQCGMGRTGTLLAVEQYDVRPDIVVMAKGIASGFPISAVGASRELMGRWRPGSHGGTYGGNPLGCAAALATLDVITAPGFLAGVAAKGSRLLDELTRRVGSAPAVRDVRGIGLMVACEFVDARAASAVIEHCLRAHRIILISAGPAARTVRWIPPLVVTDDELDRAIAAFEEAVGLLA